MGRSYLAGYWGDRSASLAESAQTLKAFIDKLASESDALAVWYLKGSSRKQALARPVATDLRSLEDCLSRSQRRGSSNNGRIEAAIGFSFDAWNGRDASLSVSCGRTGIRFGGPNAVILDLPSEAEQDSAIPEHLMTALVTNWSPEWATWTSDALRNGQGSEPGEIVVGARTYLAGDPKLATRSPLANVQVRQLGEGFEIVAGPTPSSTSMEVVAAIRASLQKSTHWWQR